MLLRSTVTTYVNALNSVRGNKLLDSKEINKFIQGENTNTVRCSNQAQEFTNCGLPQPCPQAHAMYIKNTKATA